MEKVDYNTAKKRVNEILGQEKYKINNYVTSNNESNNAKELQ